MILIIKQGDRLYMMERNNMNRMKRMTLKTGLLLFVLIGMMLLCADAQASESGIWGSLTWTLDDSGLLTISGSGDMNQLSTPDGSDAWTPYKKQIKNVVIENGVYVSID